MWKRVLEAQTLAHCAQILSLVAACLAIFGSTQKVAAAVVVLAVLAYVAHIFARRRELRVMSTKVDQLADAVDLDHIVRDTADVLGLGAHGQGWRLSLYRLELAKDVADDGHWVLVARAANQVVFEQSRDFERMQLRQGVLRVAVNAASAPVGGIDEIPPLPDPESDPDGWRQVMATWGMDGQIGTHGMRSRVYCGRVFRVGLNRGKGRDMTIALVAESESPNGVRRQSMEEALTRPVFELIYELLRLRDDMQESLAGLSA